MSNALSVVRNPVSVRSTGPLGIVPVDHGNRLGYIAVDVDAARQALEAGAKFRQFLPSKCYVIDAEHDVVANEWRITFHKPSLRALNKGEPIPRWTQKFRDEKDDVGWWEEVA